MENNKIKKNIVLMIDPRGINSIDPSGTDDRLALYGLYLKKLSSLVPLQLVVFSASMNSLGKSSRIKHAQVYSLSKPTMNPLKYAVTSSKLVKKNNYEVKLIFATDPWESFLSSYFLRIMLRRKIPIYTQVHADIGDKKWKKISFRNYLRYYLAKLTLPKSDAVRCVGYEQAKNLNRDFNIAEKIIFIIPVPIRIPNRVAKISQVRPRTIGFVGRIHKDRGIKEFTELISVLSSIDSRFGVVIVGNGDLEKQLNTDLSKILAPQRLKFFGHIPNDRLFSIWPEIGVLASTASVESYGMAMREALVNGVPIWTSKSSGSKDLLMITKNSNAHKIISLNQSISRISTDFDLLMNSLVANKIKLNIKSKNKEIPRLLASSWIDLID
jgi:glycosyltransferase involved in cell wall biosynthesis